MNKAFPPVNDAIVHLSQINYQKHMKNLLTLFLTMIAFCYAMGQRTRQVWNEHNMTDRCVSFYSWTVNEVYPVAKQFGIQLIEDIKKLMNLIRTLTSRQFVNL